MKPWIEKEFVCLCVESIDHVDSFNCFPVCESATDYPMNASKHGTPVVRAREKCSFTL